MNKIKRVIKIYWKLILVMAVFLLSLLTDWRETIVIAGAIMVCDYFFGIELLPKRKKRAIKKLKEAVEVVKQVEKEIQNAAS